MNIEPDEYEPLKSALRGDYPDQPEPMSWHEIVLLVIVCVATGVAAGVFWLAVRG